jgi:DNA polymerase-3 subunit gamma/tau
VYLIDEVHMLSNHSFNALLKTLEEPPPHVKFLLATTDPQKLPITVLSRCLQFHLKKLTVRQILEQLQKICAAESVEAEDAALESIARAAEGSLRDGLSLLDQAIAFGGGAIQAEQTLAMLGTIDRNHITKVLEALATNDGEALIEASGQLDAQAADFSAALDELMQSLQRIAVIQIVGGEHAADEHEDLAAFAERLTPEDVQLYYQIALNGRRDLAWCRDARMGFEMTLLRMLAFRPDDGARRDTNTTSASRRDRAASDTSGGGKASEPASQQASSDGENRGRLEVVSSDVAPRNSPDFASWGALIAAAELRGGARQLAEYCEIEHSTTQRIDLVLSADKGHLLTEQIRNRLQTELSRHLGRELKVTVKAGKPPRKTPAEVRLENESERMRSARESVESDSNVQAMQAAFDAVVEADSIRPVDQ